MAFLVFVFASCAKKETVDNERVAAEKVWSDSLLIAAGDLIISETFDTLRQSLLTAIGSEDFAGAISFCNEKANALTSLYSDSVKVRRTALRFRNPDNRPDSLEAEILRLWSAGMESGEKPQARLIRERSRTHYFKPIHMQAMCVNCHGAPQKNIQPATMAAIKKHYPDDLAIDFQEGDLRGSWHLIFEQGD